MTYGDFKDLPSRTASDKAFDVAQNPKYDEYQRGRKVEVIAMGLEPTTA